MITELTNPLTKTLITRLRDQKSDAFVFRHLIAEITKQLLYKTSPLIKFMDLPS